MSELEPDLTEEEYEQKVAELAEAVFLTLIEERPFSEFSKPEVSSVLDVMDTTDGAPTPLHLEYPVSVLDHSDKQLSDAVRMELSGELGPFMQFRKAARDKLVQDICAEEERVLDEFAEYNPRSEEFEIQSDPRAWV